MPCRTFTWEARDPAPRSSNSGPELAKLIDHVGGKPGKVALAINGDAVDFLAEPDAKAFDPDGAIRKLSRIVGDRSFQPVWDAFRKFVRGENRRLIITLGNHDLELALPWVRAHLLDLIADDDAARGRVILAFDGAGFLCRVGNATVLCVHGNEVDDWNVTDHETIRRFGRDLQQGRSVGAWIPNAGTHLVIDVMNDIKKGYPFVDLLKPELEAVIPVLLAVAPEKRDRISGAFPVLRRLVADKVRRATGWLGAEDRTERVSVGATPVVIGRPAMNHDALMAAAEDQLWRDVEPIALVREAERDQQLGFREAAWSWIRGGDPRETLRTALDGLQKDRSFEWTQEDDTFRQLDRSIGQDVDFILAGHTHLERALRRSKTGGFYLNSGTWVRLIKIDPKILADQAEFNKVYGALAAGTMTALDAFPELVLRKRTVVVIRAAARGTRGELMHWKTDGGKSDLKPLDPPAGMTKS